MCRLFSPFYFYSDILSHEWVSRKHGIVKYCIMLYDAKLQLRCLADPRGEQLRELQLLFRRMLRGEVRVQTDAVSQIFGLYDLVTEDEWSQVIVQSYFPDPTSKIFHSQALPHCFVWIDFCRRVHVCNKTCKRSEADMCGVIASRNRMLMPIAVTRSCH